MGERGGPVNTDDLVRLVAAAPEMAPPRALQPGSVIDETFEIVERLGAGGMGVVYRARDLRLDREVALKLHRTWDERGFGRLLHEAQAVARLSHPNVVAVHAVGTHRGQLFIAMEYFSGGSLRSWLEAERRAPREVLAAFLQAGRGLQAAHEAGLVHRDFKPDNVFVGGDRICVGDFGLARPTDAAGRARRASHGPTGATMSGPTHGTPAYMAPEQRAGGEVDARSDQFSFCLALYEALAGARPPSLGEEGGADRPPGEDDWPPLPASVPGRVARALRRGLSLDPDRRFSSMGDLLGEIAPPARSRAGWIAVLAGAGAAATAAALWGWLAASGSAAPACEPGPSALARAWTGERRSALHAGFRATALPYAEAVWRSAAALVDGYADALAAERTAACMDARVRGIASERMFVERLACLERLERGAVELVTAWSDPDRSVVESAVDAAAALTPPVTCSVPLDPSARRGPPEDDARARGAEEVRAGLARAGALLTGGKPEEAEQVARATLDRARAHGDDALLAEALLLMGRVERQRDRFAEAAGALEEGFFLARRISRPRLAAEIAAHAAEVVGIDLARSREGTLWASWAKVEVDRGVGSDALELAVESAQGALADAAGRYSEALEHYKRARALAARLYGATHPQVALALRRIGGVLQGMGELAGAAETYGEVLKRLEGSVGPRHPDVARLLRSLGLVNAHRGKRELAREQLERAVALSEEVLGARALETGYALLNLGVAHHYANQFDQAIHHYERARAIIAERLGPEHPDVGLAVNSLAVAYEGMHQFDRALEHHEVALALARGQGERHPQVAIVLGNIGAVYAEKGDHARAIARLRESVAVWEVADPDNGQMAVALRLLGEQLLEVGRAAQAVPPLERALELESRSGASDFRLARAEIALARALWGGGGDRGRALDLARRSVERFRTLTDLEPARAAAAEAWFRQHQRYGPG